MGNCNNHNCNSNNINNSNNGDDDNHRGASRRSDTNGRGSSNNPGAVHGSSIMQVGAVLTQLQLRELTQISMALSESSPAAVKDDDINNNQESKNQQQYKNNDHNTNNNDKEIGAVVDDDDDVYYDDLSCSNDTNDIASGTPKKVDHSRELPSSRSYVICLEDMIDVVDYAIEQVPPSLDCYLNDMNNDRGASTVVSPCTRIVILPHCKHAFHYDCIVPWLTKRKACCPLCGDDIMNRL